MCAEINCPCNMVSESDHYREGRGPKINLKNYANPVSGTPINENLELVSGSKTEIR